MIFKVNIISFVVKILMVIVTISSVEGCIENLMEVSLYLPFCFVSGQIFLEVSYVV